MHICIPDTREVKPQHGSSYLLYNIHIDGLYHSSLRYKQLLHLHQALSKHFASSPYYNQLAQFPPKKLLPLSQTQVEERRSQLEKYLQNISQDKAISNSSIFNLFLLGAQIESTRIREDQANLDIELVNGQKIRLQIVTHDSTDAILTAVCRALGLNDKFQSYFCLCLCGYDVVRDKLIIKRRLSFFEAPYVTLQMAIQQHEQVQNMLSYKMSTTNCTCQSCCSGHQLLRQHHLVESNTICARNSHLSTSTTSSSSSSSCCRNNGDLISYGQQPAGYNYNQTSHQNQNIYTTCQCSMRAEQQQHQSSSLPRISHNSANSKSFVTHRILLRKSYWDPYYDTHLLSDQRALDLLFIQTVYDMKHSLIFVNKETYQQLESLLASNSKLEYILLARNLKYYNYVHFEPCFSDYPRPGTKVMISIGSKELNMRVLKSQKSTLSNNGSTTAVTASLSGPATTLMPSTSASSSSSAVSSSSDTSIDGQLYGSANSSIRSSTILPSVQGTTTTNNNATKSENVLYCTSSMVPSGYSTNHLLTKDNLIEEEYNFKVPLIRCWRLTSLETLNSVTAPMNPTSAHHHEQVSNQHHQHHHHYQQRQQQRRKSFSLLNTIVGGVSSNQRNNNTINNACYTSDENNNPTSRHPEFMCSGSGGNSLIDALTHVSGGQTTTTTAMANDALSNCPQMSTSNGSTINPHFSQYELSFEYLVSKNSLRWITISSDQAIFISISLQAVVDELVSRRDGATTLYRQLLGLRDTSGHPQSATSFAGGDVPYASASPKRSSFTYKCQDGTQKVLTANIEQLLDHQDQASIPVACSQSLSLSQHRHMRGFVAPMSQSPSGSGTLVKTPPGSNPSKRISMGFDTPNPNKALGPIINDAFEGVTHEDDT